MRQPVIIHEQEQLQDLHRNGYKIIQNPNMFCFGADAVFLSSFATVHRRESAVDLCCGNGIIPILLRAKNKGISYYGIDIMRESVDMAQRSVSLNGLDDYIKIIHGDIRNIDDYFKAGSVNVVTANPPYIPLEAGRKSPISEKAAARHELFCTFYDVAAAANKLLCFGGRFYLVHKPERLTDIITILRQCKLEPKILRFIQPYKDKAPVLLLLQAVKGGGSFLRTFPPLIIYTSPGVYTPETFDIYYN